MSTIDKIYDAIPSIEGKKVIQFRNGVTVSEDYSSKELFCLIYLMKAEMDSLAKIDEALK